MGPHAEMMEPAPNMVHVSHVPQQHCHIVASVVYNTSSTGLCSMYFELSFCTPIADTAFYEVLLEKYETSKIKNSDVYIPGFLYL